MSAKVTQRKVTPRMPRTGKGAQAGHRERVAERQQRAMALRVAGASYAAIARTIGVSKQQAFRDCHAALRETLTLRDTDAAKYRELECARLDALLLACWPHAQKGNAEHVRAAVRISERRSRLLGLDAQVAAKLELSGMPLVNVTAHESSSYTALSDAELAVRLRRARETLATLVPEAPPVPAAPPKLDESPEAQRALRERESGNGNGPH